MTTINIRISRAKAGAPKGGFAGALAGGSEDGDIDEVSVDIGLSDSDSLTVDQSFVADTLIAAGITFNSTFLTEEN